METRDFPILEFDPDRAPVIQAKDTTENLGIARRCVLCFFSKAIEKAIEKYPSEIVAHSHSESYNYPIYALEYKGEKILLLQAGLGAPTAAGQMEELHARGCDIFVACGVCGMLRPDIAAGHLIVPTAAVRDEGTSYHYAPPSREIEADRDVADTIARVIQARDIPYIEGKTWTTDAFYRETRARVEKRRAEGCVTVEMECAAYIAVSRYLGVQFGQILYAGDDLTGEAWDKRDYNNLHPTRELVLDIALEACSCLKWKGRIALKKAEWADIALLNSLQVQAFRPLLEKYDDAENPGRETPERTAEKMRAADCSYYLVMLEDIPIGGARMTRLAENRSRIQQMFILPQYQNKGYAQEVLLQLEALHPEITIWELDTIKQEEKLCHLYEKMGYRRTGSEMILQENMTIVDYKKEK